MRYSLLFLYIARKTKLYYKLAVNYLSFWITYTLKEKSIEGANSKTIIFDFKSVFSERSYTQLICFFAQNGYSIFLKNNPLFIANLVQFGKKVAGIKTLHVKHINNDTEALYFYDHDQKPVFKYRKRVKINHNLLSKEALINKDKVIPYPVYPDFYFSDELNQISSLRRSEKLIRIFFSGNQNPKDYDRKTFRSYFNKLNRVEILKTLQSALDTHEIEIVESLNKIDKTAFVNKFILCRWSRESLKEKVINGRVLDNNWFNFLSRTQFFLACPGIVQPLCHNVIESMSIGVIPILEHPEMFYPNLEHNVNCIVFKGKQDLVEKIRLVLNLDMEMVGALSQNVMDYYDNHLSPKAFCNKVELLSEYDTTFFINTDGYFSKKLSEVNNE